MVRDFELVSSDGIADLSVSADDKGRSYAKVCSKDVSLYHTHDQEQNGQ